jgi:hypothetical protein
MTGSPFWVPERNTENVSEAQQVEKDIIIFAFRAHTENVVF